MDKKEIYEKILEKFGNIMQSIVAIEEMSELQKELCKFLRGEPSYDDNHFASIREEIADVQIMLEQMKLVFDPDETVEQIIEIKLQRTVDRYFKEQI